MKAVPPVLFALLPLAATILLSGCTSSGLEKKVSRESKDLAQNIASVTSRPTLATGAGTLVAGGGADTERRAGEQSSRIVLRKASKPWVASVSVPMSSGDRLPSVFQENIEINFSVGKASLKLIAERITAATGIPVRIKADVYSSPIGSIPPAPGPGLNMTPPLGMNSAAVMTPLMIPSETAIMGTKDNVLESLPMRWSESLEGYLNHITDLSSLSWEYREGVILIERFRTEFFEVAAIEGETSYSMSLSASDQGATGSGGPSANSAQITNHASTDISEQGKTSAITSIVAAIHQIIRDVPGSSAVRSDGSGRITVTTTKETMAKVREFVRAENEALLRQAQIQFDIYSIRSSEGSEQGLDWNLVLRSLSDAIAFKISSPTMITGTSGGEIGFSVLSPSETSSSRAVRFANTSTILKLLNQQGTATQHRPISLLTLNRQWARKASLGSQAYVSETTPGAASNSNGAAGAPGIKTSTITTGDRYLAQPHILDNNTVILKFGIGLSSLVGLPSFVSAGQTVQTPEVTNIIDQSTIALKAGQILAITGLSRIVTNNHLRSLDETIPASIGGSQKSERQREDFIIFVRPTIL
ncbi:MAG: hypothetical protein ACK53K_05270 [Burkholderiales bacterium]